MALFIQKALLWNTHQYQGPSGVKAGGFPASTGFGLEEWNNSPQMQLRCDGEGLRVFHTHEVGSLDVDAHAGQIFVFMTASHHGRQVLVGVAGHATCLIGTQHRKERLELVRRMGLDRLMASAWDAPSVRRTLGTPAAFKKVLDTELEHLPRWLCPDSLYWWPEEPILLEPARITGKEKLLPRFKGYATFDREQVSTIMNSVPSRQRDATWQRIVAAIGMAFDRPEDDFLPAEVPDITSRMALVARRIGQEGFRLGLDAYWNSQCAVTGASIRPLLRASHIVPWSVASHEERLDPENGLLLAAHLDALFDAALISFADDGTMLISDLVDEAHRRELGIPRPLRKHPSEAMKPYLATHRKRLMRLEG